MRKLGILKDKKKKIQLTAEIRLDASWGFKAPGRHIVNQQEPLSLLCKTVFG